MQRFKFIDDVCVQVDTVGVICGLHIFICLENTRNCLVKLNYKASHADFELNPDLHTDM